MSRVAVVSIESPAVIPEQTKTIGHGLFALWASTLVVWIWPPASRTWRRATIGQSVAVAAFNTLLAAGWVVAVSIALTIWARGPTMEMNRAHAKPTFTAEVIRSARAHFWEGVATHWNMEQLADRIAEVVAVAAFIVLVYFIPFFLYLPFGARPGSNKACFRHVARTVFLGSGMVHFAGLAFTILFLWFYLRGLSTTDFPESTAWGMYVVSGILIWWMVILIHAVRREYRGPGDMPREHDPWCDDCGYNLMAADREGRCPECGRTVLDSIGPTMRPPTAWEQRPSLWNFRAIVGQLGALIAHPRKLFYAMPTLTGQAAAQRWLIGSLAAIFAMACFIVPVLYRVLEADVHWLIVPGTLMMALTWTLFGLMMVGIETTGIATLSRMRKHPGGGVHFAAAAKVTCYSAILMLPWVVLGGAQLITYVYFQLHTTALKQLAKTHIGALSMDQLVLAVSLAAAHIGGLIWYELTVYRGIRAIQYANR